MPDWRKAGDYPSIDCEDMKRWAWEFLRRNEDYQDDARSMLELSIEWQLRTRRPTAADFLALGNHDDTVARAVLTARELAGLGDEHKPGAHINPIALSPLRVFRNKWFIQHAFSHAMDYDALSKPRLLAPTERERLRFVGETKRRKWFPRLQMCTVDPVSFTHSSVRQLRLGKTLAPSAERLRVNSSESKRLMILPNEGAVKFFFNASMQAQMRSVAKWFDQNKRAYDAGLRDQHFAAMSHADEVAQQCIAIRVHIARLPQMLRVYDAALERNLQHERQLPLDLRKELLGSIHDLGLNHRQLGTLFDDAKRYIEQGGYLAVAHHDPTARTLKSRPTK